MLVSDFLVRAAENTPEKIVIVHGKNRFSYGELLTNARAIAQWLVSSQGSKGFRAAILTDNPIDYVSLYFGIQMAGGVVVGLNTQTAERSLVKTLSDCAASVIFCSLKYKKYLEKIVSQLPDLSHVVCSDASSQDVQPHLPQDWLPWTAVMTGSVEGGKDKPPSIQDSDLAQIIYTSGTTGDPKGVMLSHKNLVANTLSITCYLNLTAEDRIMAVLPFFYSYGNSVMLTHIAAGASLVVNQNFLYPNVILDEMVEEKVTGFSGVPSTFAILLHRSAVRKYTLPALRYLTQAGAPMAPKLARSLRDIFPGVEIFIMYGQTEASARLAYLPPVDLERKSGSIGKAIPGVELHLLNKADEPVKPGEVGEIVAKGDNIMVGYWGRPEASAEVLSSYGLRTGDLAQMDEDGYLYIVSRKSDMIKSGSHRIAPKEIEEILQEHEAVHEVAVIGIEDDILGQAIKACVVLKEPDLPLKKLIIHCRKNLPAYKVPHHFEALTELPKTATGKICKNKLS